MKKQRSKRPFLIIGGIVIIALVIAALVFSRRSANSTETTADEDIVTAFLGDLSAQATASGAVQPRRQASLSVKTPGIVQDVFVHVGDAVNEGDLLLQLDNSDFALAVATAEQTVRLREANLASLNEPPTDADITAAETAVASAQANLDDILAGPTAEEIAIAEASIQASQSSVSSANAELGRTQNTIKDSQILAAEANLLAAQMNLDRIIEINEESPNAENHQQRLDAEKAVADAQAQLDNLNNGPSLGAAQSSVTAANARLEGSQADLDKLLAGATEAEIAQAELQLAQAQAALDSLLRGATETDIAVAEAELAQAQLSLADAQAQLAETSIIAPFDGMITAVNISPGEIANGTVIKLVDMSDLEVVLEVDEIDIGNLAIGQPAIITFETWPDNEIDSAVKSIAPSAQTAVGTELVTYNVHLALGETDLPVRVGLTANANLITAEKENVLLVPNRAINVDRNTGIYSVNLVARDADGNVTTTVAPITLGLRDREFTQILDGIQEGDELLVSNGAPIFNVMQGPPQDN